MCGKLWRTKHIRLPGAAPCYCNTATSLGTLVHSSCALKEICHADLGSQGSDHQPIDY